MTAPSLARLTGVELRKMVDTRAGRWLLGVIGLLCAAVVGIELYGLKPAEQSFGEFYGGTLTVGSILLPVLGILAVTGEWSQRTALTTFALVPRRWRVATAKVAAALVISVAFVAVCLAVSALGNLATIAFTDGAGSWRLKGTVIAASVLAEAIGVLGGVAFGMLLLNSPLAIVLYFVLPTAWATLGSTVSGLRTAARWLDTDVTTDPLFSGGMNGLAWARLGTSVAVWVVVPLVLGWLRLMRREVS